MINSDRWVQAIREGKGQYKIPWRASPGKRTGESVGRGGEGKATLTQLLGLGPQIWLQVSGKWEEQREGKSHLQKPSSGERKEPWAETSSKDLTKHSLMLKTGSRHLMFCVPRAVQHEFKISASDVAPALRTLPQWHKTPWQAAWPRDVKLMNAVSSQETMMDVTRQLVCLRNVEFCFSVMKLKVGLPSSSETRCLSSQPVPMSIEAGQGNMWTGQEFPLETSRSALPYRPTNKMSGPKCIPPA